ncbi:hypothetical protein Scep_007279 [Stephania cephalantha]|uniref:Uncharacterized protein n=1 Tax=Stephania cephalantha TaxID=152367 RepID=A0AAP0PLM8_9MAGN
MYTQNVHDEPSNMMRYDDPKSYMQPIIVHRIMRWCTTWRVRVSIGVMWNNLQILIRL